ncbi:BH2364 [Halalkalibacterium halodurans C-125]|uniref:BH2364 protein n=2 Tax=Halalkalibacterium halodurans TaxID=86665 RepID=Q9KAC5_HALH5|nr:BH2364 [Halalkalibacterium halodurans C-125]
MMFHPFSTKLTNNARQIYKRPFYNYTQNAQICDKRLVDFLHWLKMCLFRREMTMDNKMDALIEPFLLSLEMKGRTAGTVRRYRYDLFDFFHWMQAEEKEISLKEWKELTPEELHEFFTELGGKRNYSTRTIRRIHSVLQQFAFYYQPQGATSSHAIHTIDKPDLFVTPLKENDWVRKEEFESLCETIQSLDGLTERQREVRPKLMKRNLLVVRLFYNYGLSLQEVASLSMIDLQFAKRTVTVAEGKREQRTLSLAEADGRLAFDYWQTIPKPVRPRLHSQDAFFVAFDFQRKTYRWSYEGDEPKQWTEIGIQKMLRQDASRAGLRKKVCAQHLRNSFILSQLANGTSEETIRRMLGFTSPLSLRRYVKTLETLHDRKS